MAANSPSPSSSDHKSHIPAPSKNRFFSRKQPKPLDDLVDDEKPKDAVLDTPPKPTNQTTPVSFTSLFRSVHLFIPSHSSFSLFTPPLSLLPSLP